MLIPQYAQKVPTSRLVKVLCKGRCRGVRYAEVSDIDWKKRRSKEQWDYNNGLYATCLMCEKKAHDSYNWSEI